MVKIREFQIDDLEQLQTLVNAHIGALVPGWALPSQFLLARLNRNPSEYIVDPWVDDRKTLVGVVNDRVCAAVHILKYKDDSPAQGRGEIGWIVCWPESIDAGIAVLDQACALLGDMAATELLLSVNLYIPVCADLADCWPQLREVVTRCGFSCEDGRIETAYAGPIPDQDPGDPPLSDLTIERSVGRFGTKFAAVYDGQVVSECECVTGLTRGGELPAFKGWVEITDVETSSEWRNRGIGTWLIRSACEWLRLGGFSWVILNVDEEDEAAGAGRFYGRLGWNPIVAMERGWGKPSLDVKSVP